MNAAEIPFLSASELADAIRAGEVSPVEAVDAYLDRIEAVGDKLNAYITVCADEARADAKQMEDEAAAGNFRGPLHGVPVGIKDQIHTAGIRTTDASKIRADFVPDADATVVAKLKAAGAVVIGKTNMSEFAMGDPISSWFGPARNPWDTDRNPGTSSTGSGSATAGFLCATSLGEDTGGSIRGPAANSGLVGIRPNLGSRQPGRRGRRQLVNRHHRPNIPHRNRLRPDVAGHRRPRPQRPLQPPGACTRLPGRAGRRRKGYAHRRGAGADGRPRPAIGRPQPRRRIRRRRGVPGTGRGCRPRQPAHRALYRAHRPHHHQHRAGQPEPGMAARTL